MFGTAPRKTLSIHTHISAYNIHFKIIVPPKLGSPLRSPVPYKYLTRTTYTLLIPDEPLFLPVSDRLTFTHAKNGQTCLHIVLALPGEFVFVSSHQRCFET